VSRAALARLVNVLRGVLGESARAPRWLRTVHGYGYAFSGSPEATVAERDGRGSHFWLVLGNRRIGLREGENVIGRGAGASVRISSTEVSRRHARIRVRGPAARLSDLGSRNGTWLRGRRVEESVELSDGDDIEVGPALLVFRVTTRTAGDGRRRGLRRQPRQEEEGR
jgi:hypothetical protein